MHSTCFIHKRLRRADKIFKSMATFIGTREAEQCRSHHQKIENKAESFFHNLQMLRVENYDSLSPQPLVDDMVRSGYGLKEIGVARLLSEGELLRGERNSAIVEESVG